MGKTYYMHTIDGNPGVWDGLLIGHTGYYGPANKLESSLKDIRQHERLSHKWLKDNGYVDLAVYGHLRVEVPND